MSLTREKARKRRHKRVRKKIWGTKERPRLCVFRSHKHIYAQIIDDDAGRVLLAFSSLSPEFRDKGGKGGNVEGAKEVGRMLGEKAIKKGIKEVVFDRGGYKYLGRVKALAEGAREAGLKF